MAIVTSAACSNNDEPAGCNNSACAPGNQCLALNGETKCRKTCTSNSDPAGSCPFGYTCTDTLTGQPSPFCVESQARTADGAPLQKKAGQWGTPCQPNQGFENPACDKSQDFYCFASSPTDANAYCTRYDCTKDDECGPGFWCGAVNVSPNIVSPRRSTIGEVRNVCLKRGYCSTCNVDLDCLPVDNRPQHCVLDVNGAGFCAPECGVSANCANEARCVDPGGLGVAVCYPRANVCVGDGSLCSPCRVDTDCGEDGICVKGEYTTEKVCGKKAVNGDCNAPNACPRSQPAVEGRPEREIRCSGASDLAPAGYCIGLYNIGPNPTDIGCFTPDR